MTSMQWGKLRMVLFPQSMCYFLAAAIPRRGSLTEWCVHYGYQVAWSHREALGCLLTLWEGALGVNQRLAD